MAVVVVASRLTEGEGQGKRVVMIMYMDAEGAHHGMGGLLLFPVVVVRKGREVREEGRCAGVTLEGEREGWLEEGEEKVRVGGFGLFAYVPATIVGALAQTGLCLTGGSRSVRVLEGWCLTLALEEAAGGPRNERSVGRERTL